MRYGQAWIVYVGEEGKRIGFGHSGSDGTYACCVPEQDLMIFYFTQSRGQKTRLRLEKVFGKLLS